MKQCTQSPATTGLVVTYSKSSPTPQVFSFFSLGIRFYVVTFAPPCTCIFDTFQILTHGHARFFCESNTLERHACACSVLVPYNVFTDMHAYCC